MRLSPAFFAVTIALGIPCWFGVRAQQQIPANADQSTPSTLTPIFLDPSQVVSIAGEIAQRSEHLGPMFEQVHPADWVAQGAPEAYIQQWTSLAEQNRAIQTDMATIGLHPEAMEDTMRALFRVHRFDSDLDTLLKVVRRYQNPALADLIESVATGDQSGVEKLQQYVLDLAKEKEQQLDVEDKEAQRCRSTLANQPPGRSVAPKKITTPSK